MENRLPSDIVWRKEKIDFATPDYLTFPPSSRDS